MSLAFVVTLPFTTGHRLPAQIAVGLRYGHAEGTAHDGALERPEGTMSDLRLAQAPIATTGMLIRKPIARVFEAFVDPEFTTRFWFTRSSGRLETGKPVQWDWEMYGVSVPVTCRTIAPIERPPEGRSTSISPTVVRRSVGEDRACAVHRAPGGRNTEPRLRRRLMPETARLTRTATTLAIAATATLAAPAIVHAQGGRTMETPTKSTPVERGRVEANGVAYYYEIHGEGEPLLLLHGGLGSIEMFGPVLAMLADGRQVIGVDLHGHGRTPLGDREISLVDMGDDLAVVLEELGDDTVDVLGYSLGGGVAFRLAVQHPERVRRLVLVSAGFARDGFYPEMLPQQAQVGAAMAEMMKDTPMYRSYEAIAPNPDEFPELLDRMGRLMRTPYDWSADVKTLAMPVMLVYGDSDMYRPEHIVEFYQLLGGGLRDAGWTRENMSPNRLAILPDLTHYEIFAAPALATTVLPFLNGESGARSWAEQVKEAH